MDGSSASKAAVAPDGGAPAGLHARLAVNPYLPLTLCMLFWGGNAVASRLAVGEVSPMVLVAIRWLVVVLVLGVVARKSLKADWPLLRGRLRFIAAMGALGFTAFNALFYIAGHLTSAVNIGIIQGAIPIFVLLGAWLFQRTAIRRLQVAGVVVTMIGVVLVATAGHLENLLQLVIAEGDLMMIGACALYAGYTLGLRKRPAVSGLGFFSVLAVAAFLTTLPLLAIEVSLGKDLWPFRWQGWALVAYVALFPSFLAQIFFLRGVALIGPGRAGIFVNLVPVFAAFLAVLILGEPFQLFHGLALLLVLGGIWLAERGKRV